jgi:hypothetical protein
MDGKNDWKRLNKTKRQKEKSIGMVKLEAIPETQRGIVFSVMEARAFLRPELL